MFWEITAAFNGIYCTANVSEYIHDLIKVIGVRKLVSWTGVALSTRYSRCQLFIVRSISIVGNAIT